MTGTQVQFPFPQRHGNDAMNSALLCLARDYLRNNVYHLAVYFLIFFSLENLGKILRKLLLFLQFSI